jgi:protein-S-isoprenylcysteine O-methyltransferase Ste14
MIGIGVVFALDWLWPLLVPSLLMLHLGVVRREERYLEAKFGDAYRGYQARVSRYVGV